MSELVEKADPPRVRRTRQTTFLLRCACHTLLEHSKIHADMYNTKYGIQVQVDADVDVDRTGCSG
jgi:hypothetical protein